MRKYTLWVVMVFLMAGCDKKDDLYGPEPIYYHFTVFNPAPTVIGQVNQVGYDTVWYETRTGKQSLLARTRTGLGVTNLDTTIKVELPETGVLTAHISASSSKAKYVKIETGLMDSSGDEYLLDTNTSVEIAVTDVLRMARVSRQVTHREIREARSR